MSRLAGDSRALRESLIWLLAVGFLGCSAGGRAAEPEAVEFSTADGGVIHAHLYGSGPRTVVLAHGAVFDKESWRALAVRLASEGLRVLAFDFRGYGSSSAGREGKALHLDVMAAISYLEDQEAEQISLLGASMGGRAAAKAATRASAGALHKVILLAPAPIDQPEAMKAAEFLYLAARGERGLSRIRRQYERAPEPKRLELLDTDAHAQHVFKTQEAERLTELIVDFLSAAR